jgi:site-specific DNA recombinase
MDNRGKDQIKVATYARVSSQEQASEGTSLDYQDSQLNTFCQLQGWTISNRYIDPGFSGKDGNRPGLERLIADAGMGLFDRVVVYRLDRFARNLRLLLELEAKLRDNHVSLTFIKESIDTASGTGKMVFQLFGMIAEWEREVIMERTASGRLQRYKEGCWAGGKVPYGYAYDKATKKLVIDESTAGLIKRIFKEYSEGKTLYGICAGLNKDKILRRDKHTPGWRESAIRQMLINPMYKGNHIVHRFSHISDINKIDLSKTIQVPVPPIVTEQIWDIVQERLRTNKHFKPLTQGEFLLQGMITCGLCGYVFRTERVGRVRRYMCRGKMKNRHLDGSPRCKSASLNAEWLENEVWKRIEDIINDPNRLAVVIRETIESLRLKEADLNARIKPLNDRLAAIAEQQAKLADDWIIRHMNADKFIELKNNLDKEETRLKDLRAEIDPAQIAELESTRGTLRFWESQIKSMVWNTENEDGSMVRVEDNPHKIALKVVGFEDRSLSNVLGFPASKREMLDKLQVKLTVMNDRIEVNSLFPVEPIDIQLCTSIGGLRGILNLAMGNFLSMKGDELVN